ncbi:MAG: RNA polymerase sigma factor [Bacillota bacterium]
MAMSALEKIYDRYRVPVFRYLYRMGGSYDLAEELTQETFYRVFLSLDGFRGESVLSTWLFRIAFNVYNTHMRRQVRRRDVPLDPDIAVGGREGDPALALEDAENWRLAKLALSRLPVEYRAVIVLREIEDFSYEEIGRVLNKSPSTARVTLFRAKQKYRLIYSELTKGDVDE